MSRRSLRLSATSAMVAVVVGSSAPALAAPPRIERIPVNETFVDQFLSDACGVAGVTTTARGAITVRTFDRERPGPVELVTINVGLTATADGRTYRFRDVGADLTRITRDGTVVLQISGQVPFDFAGVLKIDVTTGEAILEPKDRSEKQLARACAALGE